MPIDELHREAECLERELSDVLGQQRSRLLDEPTDDPGREPIHHRRGLVPNAANPPWPAGRSAAPASLAATATATATFMPTTAASATPTTTATATRTPATGPDAVEWPGGMALDLYDFGLEIVEPEQVEP